MIQQLYFVPLIIFFPNFNFNYLFFTHLNKRYLMDSMMQAAHRVAYKSCTNFETEVILCENETGKTF